MEVGKYASLLFDSKRANYFLKNIDQWQLDPFKAVSPQLRQILRARIIRNDLKPSSGISETELAKSYNVSRQPVREAFITLVNEGLVEIRPQRGTYVRRIDYESVLNGRFVREAVEADIVRIIAGKPDKALIAELRAQIKEQRKCKPGFADPFIELDEQFHCMLAEAAGMHKVWDFLEPVKSQMDRVRYITFKEFPTSKLIQQHEMIVDCMEMGSPNRAQTAMRTHLREILQVLPEVLKRYPDYFDTAEAIAETNHLK
jgi:GntR family transcriptional regulator, rspAB operon transcriptional repressor